MLFIQQKPTTRAANAPYPYLLNIFYLRARQLDTFLSPASASDQTGRGVPPGEDHADASPSPIVGTGARPPPESAPNLTISQLKNTKNRSVAPSTKTNFCP